MTRTATPGKLRHLVDATIVFRQTNQHHQHRQRSTRRSLGFADATDLRHQHRVCFQRSNKIASQADAMRPDYDVRSGEFDTFTLLSAEVDGHAEGAYTRSPWRRNSKPSLW